MKMADFGLAEFRTTKVSWCILFRKTTSINIKYKNHIVTRREPALAGHDQVPEVRDSMSQDSRKQGLHTLRVMPVRGTSLSQSFQAQPPGSMAFLLAYPQMALLWEVW